MACALRERLRPPERHRRVSVSVLLGSTVTVPRRRTPCHPQRRHQLRRNHGRTRSSADATRRVGWSQLGQWSSAGRMRPKKIVARMIRRTNRPPKIRAKRSASDIGPFQLAVTQWCSMCRDEGPETIPPATPHSTPDARECRRRSQHGRLACETPRARMGSYQRSLPRRAAPRPS